MINKRFKIPNIVLKNYIISNMDKIINSNITYNDLEKEINKIENRMQKDIIKVLSEMVEKNKL